MEKHNHLVAHRGYSAEYPENTLLAIQSALALGAHYVELDVQLTADKIPVVVHDANLNRVAGCNLNVMDLDYTQLINISVHEPQRFGGKYNPQRIKSLQEIVQLFQEYEERKLIVEAKRSSILNFGVDCVLKRIIEVLEPLKMRSILISFHEEFIKRARQTGTNSVGWVFDHWEPNIMQKIASLNPQFVFADHECIPSSVERLPDDRRWGLYTVDNPVVALEWFKKGAALVETNNIRALLEHFKFMPN